MRRIEISAGFNLDPEYTAEMLARREVKFAKDKAYKDGFDELSKTGNESPVKASYSLKDTSWMALGNCIDKDRDLFFKRTVESQKPAKAICQTCVVIEVLF